MSGNFRITVVAWLFTTLAAVVWLRLVYWQVFAADKLASLAASQRENTITVSPDRGDILANDGYPLVANQEAYLAFLEKKKLNISIQVAIEKLSPLLAPNLDEVQIATDIPKLQFQKDLLAETAKNLEARLNQDQALWIPLKHKVNISTKTAIEQLDVGGIGFEKEQQRIYPEASMAAHLLGFVGANHAGLDTGYFGLEGYYDLELKGREGSLRQERDAANKPILIGDYFAKTKRDGRTLQLHLDRAVQFFVEKHLKDALRRYRAKSGSVVIMDPKTGAILAMTSEPAYAPKFFGKYTDENYKNPVVNELYEPGSTFKVVTMAAGIEAEVVKADTQCDICSGPYKIDKYFIRTWDNKYRDKITMTEALVHSDNVAMVFVAQRLGKEAFVKKIKEFGFGQKTGIDLQEEVSGDLRQQWNEVDLAVGAFGQGLAVTGMQMVKAVGAIANGGKLMEPQVVYRVIGDKEVVIKPKVVGQAVSPETAEVIKEMMVAAVEEGEAKWAAPKGYRIAGKTGTSQIPIAGHYDTDKTIASFVGFAPADNPRFVMLTKLREPQTSPWGSETAAPLFFRIAKDLLLYWGIPPSP